MTSSNQLQFETLVINNDYEISSNHYPYIIRKRSNHRVVKENTMKNGYRRVKLNGKDHYIHRIAALQWIHNDDPENKTQIDHVNHDRTDNRLQNLRWCTASENTRNRSKYGDNNKFEYIDELGNEAFEVTSYNNHEFEDLWFDPQTDCFYYYTGAAYKELHYYTTKAGALFIQIQDIQHVYACITLSKFKKSLEDDDSDEE